LTKLEEINSYFEEFKDENLSKRVVEAIDSSKKETQNIVVNHLKMEESFGIAKEEEFKKSLSHLAESKTLADSQLRDWKKVSEALQAKLKSLQETIDKNPTPESYDEALAFNRSLRISFLEQKKALKEAMGKMEAQLEGQNEVNKALKMVAEKAIASKKATEVQNKKYVEQLKEAQSTISAYNKKLEENKKAMEALVVKYESAPKVALRKNPDMPIQFTEKADVENYWKDLKTRHGADIEPYKNRIIGCKTLQEAMMIYTKILPSIKEVQVLPGNIPEKARLSYIHEATGRQVKPVSSRTPHLPEGWI